MKLYSHSTLKIHEDDDVAFTEFIQKHQHVMRAMGGNLSFDHITEKEEIVSMFGRDRTFLGKGLRNDGFAFDFRVFEPLETSESPQIKKIQTHMRRVEGLKVGIDIRWTDLTLEDYELLSGQKRIARNTLDTWHQIGTKIGLFNFTDSAWRSSRYLGGGNPFISWENRNRKLVVKYGEKHRFTSILESHLKAERRAPQKSTHPEWFRDHFKFLVPVF